jgi:flagellar hook assembly protein FlgD
VAGTILYRLGLRQSAPNPYYPASGPVTISFTVAGGLQELSAGALARERAELSIYDVRGALVRRIFSQPLIAGDYDVHWDGTSESGDPVGSGVYFYRLGVASHTLTRKIVVVR